MLIDGNGEDDGTLLLPKLVKCGDTLRRFNTYVNENDKLELDMAQLREKMRGLFSLAVDDDFTLMYTDMDGDIVTLVEDYDLDDVVLQRLNPVRMLVTLKIGDKGSSFNMRSSWTSRAMESPRVHQSVENIQAGIDEVMNTLPEPLRGTMWITRDRPARVSAPVLAKDIHFAKSITCQESQTLAPEESNLQNKASEGETGSGLSGSKSKKDAEARDENFSDIFGDVNADLMDFGMCALPDLNNTPPLPSKFATIRAPPSACSNKTEKGNTWCPTFAERGSSNLDVHPFNECPFSGTHVDAIFHPSNKGNVSSQLKPSHNQIDGGGPVYHTRVQCDACGVHPITGPRFKSNVRYDYDLCYLCYQKYGNEAEYVNIDNPLLYGHIMKALHRKYRGRGHRFQTHVPFKPIADPFVPFTIKPVSLVNQVKLNSRFILDVNVMDGTVMAPSTCFTKIWRMQNTGNDVWPMGTRLVWTNGDIFSNALSVDLEIPDVGVSVGRDLDVAVYFVAPELPGEYVSYWRMSSPSGKKFGQRVWVSIQVGASLDPLSGSSSQLNLNLPPQSNGLRDPIPFDINVEPSMNNSYSPRKSYPVAASSEVINQHSKTVTQTVDESVSGIVDRKQNLVFKESTLETTESASNDQHLNFLTDDTSLNGDLFYHALAQPFSSSVSYPVVDSSKIVVRAPPLNVSSNVESLEPSPQLVFDEEHKELSKEGCHQTVLKKEISRAIDSDVEVAHDFSGWDPILDELEEMGFSDKKKNIELMLKNKGSIKRVVMDLVIGERSQ